MAERYPKDDAMKPGPDEEVIRDVANDEDFDEADELDDVDEEDEEDQEGTF